MKSQKLPETTFFGADFEADLKLGNGFLPSINGQLKFETQFYQRDTEYFSGVRIDEEFFDYHHVDGVNFRGADLKGAEHNFANMLDADFSGAELVGFMFGYAHIEGRINSHTTFDDFGCESDGSRLSCSR